MRGERPGKTCKHDGNVAKIEIGDFTHLVSGTIIAFIGAFLLYNLAATLASARLRKGAPLSAVSGH